jgi:hypothetical protein
VRPDWIERKTAELLKRARRSGYFADVIRDAEHFEAQGHVWDVALAISLSYWDA